MDVFSYSYSGSRLNMVDMTEVERIREKYLNTEAAKSDGKIEAAVAGSLGTGILLTEFFCSVFGAGSILPAAMVTGAPALLLLAVLIPVFNRHRK